MPPFTAVPTSTLPRPTLPRPIRVLTVDDSPFFRKILVDTLSRHTDLQLIPAGDPYEARDRLAGHEVDVMTLDLEMPRMDGLTFLKLIMDSKPMPVIILSSLTPAGSQKAVEALIAGAFDVIGKPEMYSGKDNFEEKLVHSIHSAAAAPLRRRRPMTLSLGRHTRATPHLPYDPRQLIALGASTGGTQALREILGGLPANLPGIAIVQHIPPIFSASFAERLNQTCAMEVREAKDGDILHSGLALVAPGDQHMEINWVHDRFRVALSHGPMVEHQRPSVDVLFQSLARSSGPHTIAALLTGMGRDGAAGLKSLHDLRAHTIAQDARSCVVYGMPREAAEIGAVDSVVPLENIAGEILRALSARCHRTTSASHA